MIEGYIIKIERCLRSDNDYVFITSDTVFTNLNKTIEESRRIYNEYLNHIATNEPYKYYDKPFDEKRFSDNDGAFFISDTEGYYVEGTIEKVSIDLDNKQLKKDNNG